MSQSPSCSLRYAVDDNPGAKISAFMGIQHVLLIFNLLVLPVVVLGKSAGLPAEEVSRMCFAGMLASAAACVVQTMGRFGVGAGLVIYIGSAPIYLAVALPAVLSVGVAGLSALTMTAALSGALFSLFLRHFRNILTPHLGGTLLVLLVVDLMHVAVSMWQGGADAGRQPASQHLFLGLTVIGVMTAAGFLGGKFIRMWSPLLGMIGGFIFAGTAGLIDMKLVAATPWFGLPSGHWIAPDFSCVLARPELVGGFLLTAGICAVMTVGTSMMAQKISIRGCREVDYGVVQRAIRADSAGLFLAGLLGGFPTTTYVASLPILEMTGVAAKRVAYYAAGGMVLLAFSPKIGALVVAAPASIFGGFLFFTLAMIFYSGISLAFSEGANRRSGLMMGLSVSVGMLAEQATFFPSLTSELFAPFAQSGLAAGGLTALCLSLVQRRAPKKRLVFKQPASPVGLHEFLNQYDVHHGMLSPSPGQALWTRLALEETFSHILERGIAKNRDRYIRSIIERKEEGLFVEMHSCGLVEGLEPACPESEEAVEDERRIRDLGLALLARTGKNIRHMFISGHTYISFYMTEGETGVQSPGEK